MKRFWDKVNKTDNCWLWTAYLDIKGYGRFGVNGKLFQTHRLSWMLHNGDIPEGLWVLHHCDNPPCVNPDHLFLGTAKDNVQDMLSKHRENYSSGENHYLSKLTVKKVEKIRALYKKGKHTKEDIGKLFGVTGSNISLIVNNKTWK